MVSVHIDGDGSDRWMSIVMVMVVILERGGVDGNGDNDGEV